VFDQYLAYLMMLKYNFSSRFPIKSFFTTIQNISLHIKKVIKWRSIKNNCTGFSIFYSNLRQIAHPSIIQLSLSMYCVIPEQKEAFLSIRCTCQPFITVGLKFFDIFNITYETRVYFQYNVRDKGFDHKRIIMILINFS
jgi:hypothetical protein